MNDANLWVEQYRPKTISECVLTDDLKNTFQQFVDNKQIPNLLLSGVVLVSVKQLLRKQCLKKSVQRIC